MSRTIVEGSQTMPIEKTKSPSLGSLTCAKFQSDHDAVKSESSEHSHNLHSASQMSSTTPSHAVKDEPDSSSSMLKTEDSDIPMSGPSRSGSSTPTPPPASAIPSDVKEEQDRKSSTPPVASSSNSRKLPKAAPQLIGHLPAAREDALSTFKEMPDNWYQFKSLGRSREFMESMTCDCVFEPGDHPELACGHGSECINRLTQVECLPDDCRCGSYCKNQRFQKKEYANIDIVKTELKGFGLRAEVDIPKDTFIYEYVGDVVNNIQFKKRMRDYANEGIEHFYFMMLQKDEFIDATKSGGLVDSQTIVVNPNCYVAKWTIGKFVRMGIFAKRHILKNEELTFNYNVDRYGHQAQTCHCGEPNCVGYIGGKTQTDISAMDELYLDALGITDEADLMELKGTKKKKGKKIDDPDFMPQMKPVVEKEIPKVIQAMSQTSSRKVLSKLLTRLKITDDQAPLRQVIRLRGYSCMKVILEDNADDLELISLAMECMSKWPSISRNKIEDSRVDDSVKKFMESENEQVKGWATKLYEQWQTLELTYRIPKRALEPSTEEEEKLLMPSEETSTWQAAGLRNTARPESESRLKRPRVISEQNPNIDPLDVPYWLAAESRWTTLRQLAEERKQQQEEIAAQKELQEKKKVQQAQAVEAIIAAAAKERAELEAAAQAQALINAEKEKKRLEEEEKRKASGVVEQERETKARRDTRRRRNRRRKRRRRSIRRRSC
ncbi:histone methyltransferase set2 [Stygiomarasmius scandens]|uniref:Histone-lysine N-methyltransferase, H3 lysine-36 specific n=1 Tax=Marasmiellus scandens TaxID=2682957 RepID=A0ABR1J356_9AGAR